MVRKKIVYYFKPRGNRLLGAFLGPRSLNYYFMPKAFSLQVLRARVDTYIEYDANLGCCLIFSTINLEPEGRLPGAPVASWKHATKRLS